MEDSIKELSKYTKDNYARRVRSILNRCINSLYEQTLKDGDNTKSYIDDYQTIINCQKYLCQLGSFVNKSFPCKKPERKRYGYTTRQ